MIFPQAENADQTTESALQAQAYARKKDLCVNVYNFMSLFSARQNARLHPPLPFVS